MDENLKLVNLLPVESLQSIQDAFCRMTGMAAGISDENGIAVTKDSVQSTDFCFKYNKRSKIGLARCQKCDKAGGELALKEGKSVAYRCHSGMVDFAAPILVEGRMIGCFLGGQVRTGDIDEERLRRIAVEIEVDPDGYVEAAKRTKVLKVEEITHAAEFVYTIANIMSDMAYNRYKTLKASEEVDHAAHMKSDFLANMSHEIRTPMNAVIGMAEMALREELPPAARDYINQIKSSGKALLAIINDILDFSKIESGKMDIIESEYEILSVVNDVANIVMTRIGEKDVELILDVDPNIPNKLIGDSNRIKQVILNIANNAVKFTSRGKVVLKIDYKKTDKDVIELYVSVQDTGIGIKPEDLKKLFVSFQQVDSKRNRNVEGTGLGLAISKQLVSLMGGEITVKSEYGKGSSFSFSIPQVIFDEKPSVRIKKKEDVITVGLIRNQFIRRQLKKDIEKLGYRHESIEGLHEYERIGVEQESFLFIEHALFTDIVKDFVSRNPQITAILLTDFRTSVDIRIANLIVVKKPLYVLNLAAIFNHEDLHLLNNSAAYDDFEYTAPDAEILIVDDNAINLTVAEGLLKPLEMKIDTALSGKEAVQKIDVKKYDLILMDHMMPELDGVETTHIIRRFHEEYNDVPILALTANAVEGARDMFLREGMNDFIAKPIEMRTIVTKLRQWLPQEKIKRIHHKIKEEDEEEEIRSIEIPGLDTESALQLLGTENLFWAVLKDYYRVIEKKAALIRELQEKEDWAAYTIEVHALKSASKQIGAMELSAKAAELEKAGNARDTELIREKTDDMVQQYLSYVPVLEPFCKEEEVAEADKQEITEEVLQELFGELRDAMEELDMDRMEEVSKELSGYRYDEQGTKFCEELRNAVEELDVDLCESILEDWEKTV